jgi:PAS domain S-box-containing protein
MSSPLCILCLENDPTDAQLLQESLESEGIARELTRVETESDFRAALQQREFDLILADYTLPSFDGLSALRIVRERCADVPFIFVSGTIGEEIAIEALKMGATDYVFKTRLSRLVPAINRAVHEARVRAELRRADESLKRSETYLLEAQRLTHTGSYAFDGRREVFTYWSQELFRIWGFDLQPVPPDVNTLRQRIHPDDRAWVHERLMRSVRERSPYSAQYRLVLADGTTKHIEAIGHHMSTVPGGPVELIGTHRDISERVRAEEQREKLRVLEAELQHMNRITIVSELGTSLAHELNQPITGAIASADACLRWLARDPPELEGARAATLRVKRDATRAVEIINRLRAFYRKSDPPHQEAVDVCAIVEQIIVLLRAEANRHAVAIRTEVPAQLPNILADRVPLQQVFMNLMLNAIEAMHSRGGELTIRAQRDQQGMVLVSISDTGVGLPTDGAERIFEAFFTTKPQGTGMGLAITRSIVEAHGGRLWASPNAAQGVTFHFTVLTVPER